MGGGGNLALPIARGLDHLGFGLDKTWTIAGERLEVSVWVTNCFG